MEVIILSGGLGTRLNGVIKNIPKVMAPINDKPFLEYVLNDLNEQKVNKVILATGYKKEYIKDYFGNKYKNIIIEYSEEEQPLGTGGAILKALTKVTNNNVIIMNGDIYTKLNFADLYKSHLNSGADVTLSLKMMENFERYGSVTLNNNRITDFNEKKFISKGYMSVGCYVFNRDVLADFKKDTNFSIENDFFTKYVKVMNFMPYFYHDVFIDIGIPEDYELIKKVINYE